MINFYITENGKLSQCDEAISGCWISVVDPTPQEIKILIDDYGLDSGFVKSSLDEEESSRIEREDEQTLVIIDTPVSTVDDDKTRNFYTQPMGIIITDDYVLDVVCIYWGAGGHTFKPESLHRKTKSLMFIIYPKIRLRYRTIGISFNFIQVSISQNVCIKYILYCLFCFGCDIRGSLKIKPICQMPHSLYDCVSIPCLIG